MCLKQSILKKLRWKPKKNNDHLLILTVLMAAGMLLLTQGLIMFAMGFHNMDQAQNLMRLGKEKGIEILEVAIGGGIMTLPDMYISGTRMIVTSIYYIIVGVSLQWISFMLLMRRRK